MDKYIEDWMVGLDISAPSLEAAMLPAIEVAEASTPLNRFVEECNKRAQQAGCLMGSPQKGLYQPLAGAVGSTTPKHVITDFLNHLAGLLSLESKDDTTVSMCKIQRNIVHVYVQSEGQFHFENEYPGHTWNDLARTVEAQMTCLLHSDSALGLTEARQKLRHILLGHFYLHATADIATVHDIFDSSQESYNDFAANTIGCGLTQEESMDFPVELGELLIGLHEKTNDAKDGKIRRDVYFSILDITSAILSLSDLPSRLRKAVGEDTFSEALLGAIYSIAMPDKVTDSFVQASHAWSNYEGVKLHNRFPSTLSSTIISVPPHLRRQSPPRLAWPSGNEMSGKSIAYRAATKGKPITDRPAFRPANPRDYLSQEEHEMGPRGVAPIAKRHSLALLECVLNGRVPNTTSDAYLLFGFAACINTSEKNLLRNLYQAILRNCKHKQGAFRALWQALQSDTLIEFFAHHGYLFDTAPNDISNAVTFFRFSSKFRPTVYRLKQFLDTDNTNPPSWMRRDYGFQYCKGRDDVSILKGIYSAVLDKCLPLELHAACIEGDLFEFANRTGVYVEHKLKRLMLNAYPHPNVGFEDDTEAKGYEGHWFRNRKKGGN